MKKIFFMLGAALLFGCGCSSYPVPPTVVAGAAETMVIDGKLTEKSWSETPEYSLTTAREMMEKLHPDLRETYGRKPASPGKVRLLFDRDYLYIGAVLTDDDIFSYAVRDQQLHCNEGDTFEIFLKPENANHYWEIHISPAGYCAVLFYPSRGCHFLPQRVLPKIRPLKKIKHKSVIDGTLNQFGDVDRVWTLEAAIPLDELAARGVPLDQKNRWRLLIGRYNFSGHQKICELSSFPQLNRFSFHVHEEYSFLKLADPEEKRH